MWTHYKEYGANEVLKQQQLHNLAKILIAKQKL
jgi:hypothetical protein